MAPVSQAPRRYLIELSAAFVLYLAALFGRVYALKEIADPTLKIVVTLLPILAVCLIALAIFRFYRRMDEYHRLRFLKALAITGGATGLIAASWSFLQDVGAPPLSNYGVLIIATSAYVVVTFLFRLDTAVAEGRIGKATRNLAWLSIAVGVVAATYWLMAEMLGWPRTISLVTLVAAAIVVGCISLSIGSFTEMP